MIKNYFQDFDTVMDDLGLFINDKTGGFYDSSFDGILKKNCDTKSEKYEILYPDKDVVMFFNGAIFFKSLLDTEASFNIKLFV